MEHYTHDLTMAKGCREVYKCIMFILVFTLSSGINLDLDVGFIIDGSGSVNDKDPNNWRFLLDFVVKVVGKLPQQGTQVGVVVFSKKAELRVKLNRHADLYFVMQAISHLQYPGSETNTSGGLYITRTELFNVQNGDRPNASNVAILITDVDDLTRAAKEKTIKNAQDVHRDGIRVICIGISDNTTVPELRAISSPSHEMDLNYFIVKDFYSLATGDLTYRLIKTIFPTIFETTTQVFPRISTHGNFVPIDETEPSGINLLVIIIPIICCIIFITIIIVILIYIRRHLLGKCHRNDSNTSFGEDEEITQSATATHLDAPGVYHNTTDDGRENINAVYEEILEIENDSEVNNCEEDKGQYEEVQSSTHTYQQLLTKQKPLTIESLIEKNNLPNTLGKVLKKQNITTIPVLSLLTEKDIEDLGLSIGDRSQLRAAIKTLIED